MAISKTVTAALLAASLSSCSKADPLPSALVCSAQVGDSQDVMLVTPAGEKHIIASDPARDLDVHTSPGGKYITFTSARNHQFNIYACDNTGKNLTNLTNGIAYADRPTFSLNGEWIAYRTNPQQDRVAISVMSVDGSGKQEIARAEDIIDFCWSPDNQRLIYSTVDGDISRLCSTSRMGGIPTVLKSSGIEGMIQVANPGNGVPAQFPKRTQVREAACAPDGQQIAYVKYNTVSPHEIRILNTDGSQDRQLLTTEFPASDLQWSKDSKSILYSCPTQLRYQISGPVEGNRLKGEMHIFVTNLSGHVQQLTYEGMNRVAVWSPDGLQIGYLHANNATAKVFELYTMNRDGTNKRKIADSIFGQTRLHWY